MISPFVDLALGVSLIWLVMAAASSALLEGIRILFRRRQKTLFAAIGTLLDGTAQPPADSATAQLYKTAEFRRHTPRQRLRRLGRQRPLRWYRRQRPDPVRLVAATGPEWISPSAFGSALATASCARRVPEAVRQEIVRFSPADQTRTVAERPDQAPPDQSQRDGTGFGPDQAAKWFEANMNVVSATYQRTTRIWLFVIGLALAIVFHVDAFRIAERLWYDAQVRQMTSTAPPTTDQLETVTALPIGWGWSCGQGEQCGLPARIGDGAETVAGLVASASAVSLGTPFWYRIVMSLSRGRDRTPTRA